MDEKTVNTTLKMMGGIGVDIFLDDWLKSWGITPRPEGIEDAQRLVDQMKSWGWSMEYSLSIVRMLAKPSEHMRMEP